MAITSRGASHRARSKGSEVQVAAFREHLSADFRETIVIMSCSPFTAGARERQEIGAVQRSAEGGFTSLPALEPASLKKAGDRIHGIVHPSWTMPDGRRKHVHGQPFLIRFRQLEPSCREKPVATGLLALLH
jgi:hypothetical protein